MKLFYTNDVTLNEQVVQGSDGRLNVSSRSDGRSYYISRFQQESYSLVWADASSADGDYIAYWKNDNAQGKHLIIESVGVNADETAQFQMLQVTGTAAGGASGTPACQNRAAPRVAAATARTAVTDAITGLTDGVILDHVGVQAYGHQEMRTKDRVRLGEGQAVGIKMLVAPGTPAQTWGVVFGYYE